MAKKRGRLSEEDCVEPTQMEVDADDTVPTGDINEGGYKESVDNQVEKPTRGRNKKRKVEGRGRGRSAFNRRGGPDERRPYNESSFPAGDINEGGYVESVDNQVENPTRGRNKRRKVQGRGPGRSAFNRRGGPGERRACSKSSSDDSNCLFEIVKRGKSSLQSVVDDWIEAYEQDRDKAWFDLMHFFIQCAGCKGRIASIVQGETDHSHIIRKMTEELDQENGDYPLIMSGPQWKKFSSNFCEFVQVLVRQCQYSIIYDMYLLDNLTSLLTGLSDSQVRAFRHTATLAAVKLVTALVDVALNLTIRMDNAQRQYEAERKKNNDEKAPERLEMLMSKCKDLDENMKEIKTMLNDMFNRVFVHRYRDTFPEIRSICIYEIGQWMKKFHQHFLDDSHLKYIGWTLYDKDGDVRLKCLQALLPLYRVQELTTKLELFTTRFKDRILTMTLDDEYQVAVHAVKLILSIQKYRREILTDQDCEHVYQLVYSSRRAVAQAAGQFLSDRLFQPDQEAAPCCTTQRGVHRSINSPLIRNLVRFFIESGLHEHAAYLVDSMIESKDMIKDWECMTDLLLRDHGPQEQPLDDRQETSLIKIMVCCVKQVATGEPPAGRCPHPRQPSAKELKQLSVDRIKLTEHFIHTLPDLLRKYLPDEEKLANLIILPQFFDLEIYTTSRQDNNLGRLLDLTNEIFENRIDTKVLQACAKTYESLCNEQLAIYSRCAVARGTLIDTLVDRYKQSRAHYSQAGEELDDDDIYAVISALKRVSIFYSCHNLGPWGIWDDVYRTWVRCAVLKTSLPEQAVKHAIFCCSVGLMWDLAMLDDTSPTPEALHNLQVKLQEFVDTMTQLLNHLVEMLAEEAFLTICDLLIVFRKQLADNSGLTSLVYEPDPNLREQLSLFVQNKVFVEDQDDEQDEQTKIKQLRKRRNFLASFCKLITYNVIEIKHAGDIFKHYVRFYNDYGDIIKETLGKAREINKVNCARTMVLSLTSLFNDLPSEQNTLQINRQDESFLAVKELAKRFALTFGLDQVKNREALAALHREGIWYAVNPLENPTDPMGPPPNLPFLEILAEFSNKLVKQDKKVVLNYLDCHVQASMPGTTSEDWQPLIIYQNSLVHGEAEQPPPQAPGRQYRGKERQRGEDDIRNLGDGNSEQDSDHGSDG